MNARVALVGHCGPDMSYLTLTVRKALPEAKIDRVNDEASLAEFLKAGNGLLLVNRVLDGDFADENGIALIGRVKPPHPHISAMLISNYEESQTAAVQAGALPGFGKRDIGSPKVLQLLAQAVMPEGSHR